MSGQLFVAPHAGKADVTNGTLGDDDMMLIPAYEAVPLFSAGLGIAFHAVHGNDEWRDILRTTFLAIVGGALGAGVVWALSGNEELSFGASAIPAMIGAMVGALSSPLQSDSAQCSLEKTEEVSDT